MLFVGICLVGIAYQLLPDSTHQHLLKSLRVIGFVLVAFAIALSTKLRSSS
jgi:ABC-type enterochelin transport system permease subunit